MSIVMVVGELLLRPPAHPRSIMRRVTPFVSCLLIATQQISAQQPQQPQQPAIKHLGTLRGYDPDYLEAMTGTTRLYMGSGNSALSMYDWSSGKLTPIATGAFDNPHFSPAH